MSCLRIVGFCLKLVRTVDAIEILAERSRSLSKPRLVGWSVDLDFRGFARAVLNMHFGFGSFLVYSQYFQGINGLIEGVYQERR